MKRYLYGALGALALLALTGFAFTESAMRLVDSSVASTSYFRRSIVGSCDGDCPAWGTADGPGDLVAEDAIEANGALDVAGAATLSGAITASSTVAVTGLTTTTGGHLKPTLAITDTATLTSADCGQMVTVSAGIDTKTITLPAALDGCTYEIMYIGADGGALVDISPNASDGIHGSCTLAASVLEFSGTDDADIGLTKATANTGDTITLASDGAVGWYVTACAGIWANN